MDSNIFLNRYPSVDLHGLDRDSARMVINDFVNENLFLKNEMIVIIHGIGTGIIKKEVHEALRVNKNVIEYKTDNFNSGCTIVKLNVSSKISKKKKIDKEILSSNDLKNELEKQELNYLYYIYDNNKDDVDVEYMATLLGDWISGLYKSKYLYAVFDFNKVKSNKYICDIVVQVLEHFLQLVDYKIDKKDYKINVYKKYDELLVRGIVKKIDIRYFLGLFRYNIDFKDKNVFVIHSPNGCGKTNLLETINSLFQSNNNFHAKSIEGIIDRLKYDINNKFGRKVDLKNEFFDECELMIQNGDVNNEFVVYRKENSDQLFISNKENNKSSFINGGECIYFKNLQFGNSIPVIFLTKSLLDKYRNSLLERKVKRFNEIMNVFFCFEKTVELKMENLENCIKVITKHKVTTDNLEESIKHVNTIDISNKNLFDIRYKEKNKKNIPGVFKYDQKIDFDLLSTGEKNIIHIFFKLIFGTRYGSFILLDEPEISLHIEWQALLIKNIVKLAEENDFKFLIATHSPYIADNPDVVVGRAIDEC